MEIQKVSPNVSEIVWEKDIIRIPFSSDNEKDSQIYKVLNFLKERVEKLEKEKGEIETLSVTHEQAKEKMITFLKHLKLAGHGKVDIFEISHKLKIPATQVEDVLMDLQKEGIVKELD